MAVTVYKDIPARVWHMQGQGKKSVLTLASTKAYRRIMDEIERAMRNGGAVEMESRTAEPNGKAPQSGDVQEWISATIDYEAAPAPPAAPRQPKERRQLRLLDIARAA